MPRFSFSGGASGATGGGGSGVFPEEHQAGWSIRRIVFSYVRTPFDH